MMMERAAPAPEQDAAAAAKEKPAAAPLASAAATAADASAEDRVQDLERRLNALGGESGASAAEAAASPAPVAAASAPAAPAAASSAKPNPLLKRIQAAQERARLAEQKERDAKAAEAAEADRRRREEEESRIRAEEEARIQRAQSALRSVAGRALEDRQRDILAQLEGRGEEEAAAPAVAPPPAAFAPPATMAGQAPPEAAVPIMKTLDPPPPSFDSMRFPPPKEMQDQIKHPSLHPPPRDGLSPEMKGHGMNSRVLTPVESAPPPIMPGTQLFPPAENKGVGGGAPPPAFDDLMMMSTPVESAPPVPEPTAPSISPDAPHATLGDFDHLHGVMPMAPPQQQQAPPPPSFDMFESQQQTTAEAAPSFDDDVLAYDEEGNPLTPEQRQAMIDEQRRLYESIMKEKAANDAAIAEASADAFDSRSSSAAARAMSPGNSAAGRSRAGHEARARAMDSVGRDVAEEGEEDGEEGEEEGEGRSNRRMVKIGNNQMVALHGQDRTKKAIRDGTAILVQCINCQNWMQVTDTATLMFCPVCQVVSPVIQQSEVLTKEEAIQLTMDRKLAEKLQAEAYAQGSEEGEEGGQREEEGYLSKFFGGIGGAVVDGVESVTGSGTSAGAASSRAGSGSSQAHPQSDSWWNKISSIVSYGVASEPRERGDMGVTRPPGAPAASPTASLRGSASRSPTHAEETRGLLSPVVVDGDEAHHHRANLPSGRVAESRPLFSCVMDSVSSAAGAVFSTGEADGEGNVHGVDSSSLLVTNAGRGVGDGAGDYSQLPDREFL